MKCLLLSIIYTQVCLISMEADKVTHQIDYKSVIIFEKEEENGGRAAANGKERRGRRRVIWAFWKIWGWLYQYAGVPWSGGCRSQFGGCIYLHPYPWLILFYLHVLDYWEWWLIIIFFLFCCLSFIWCSCLFSWLQFAVHGLEYGFGAHDYPTSGVFEVEPRKCPGFVYRCSITLGYINIHPHQVRAFIEDLASEYRGDTYHLISKNCNHFTDDVSNVLTGRSIPGWVNRLAWLGNYFIFYNSTLCFVRRKNSQSMF